MYFTTLAISLLTAAAWAAPASEPTPEPTPSLPNFNSVDLSAIEALLPGLLPDTTQGVGLQPQAASKPKCTIKCNKKKVCTLVCTL